MTRHVHHDLKINPSRDEQARQDFVSALRVHVLNDMAGSMKQHFVRNVAPAVESRTGKAPDSGQAVHDALKPDLYFKFYSGLRVNAQEMVWESVRPAVERAGAELTNIARAVGDKAPAGTLTLDPELEVPDYVTAIDVHLMPGNYQSEAGPSDLRAGALYDNGLSVFSMGLMGSNLDDIGRSVAGFIKAKYPDFKPARILDMGCTIGHNTCPWAREYPDAEVTGIDVAAPVLRYAHARAQAQGVTAHFRQADATAMPFEDNSFDVVFSSMFLHELPKKAVRQAIAEAKRVLKPGGLLINMELPPNDQLSPYEGFYLDWDCYYNQEPYYRGYRDLDTRVLCKDAGFAPDAFFQHVIPSREGYGEEVFQAAVDEDRTVDSETTGRLAAGIQWYVFGAWA